MFLVLDLFSELLARLGNLPPKVKNSSLNQKTLFLPRSPPSQETKKRKTEVGEAFLCWTTSFAVMVWVVNATEEVDRQSQYPVIVGVCIALTALSMLVVGGRLWIRSTSRGLASDDHMALLSEVFVVVYAALTIARKSRLKPRQSSNPHRTGRLTFTDRNEIRPRPAYCASAEGEPRDMDAGQLRR